MAECNITSVQVLNNPAKFTDPIVLEVQYECLSNLQEDLVWRVVYVGSAESDQHDQVLDSALLGPVQQGSYRFRMEAPAPDPNLIPAGDLLGVTALLLTGSYREQEFVRVGYYVNIEYTDPELLDPEAPLPNPPLIDKLWRSIMADHPRVTHFPHNFDAQPEPAPLANPLDPNGTMDNGNTLQDDEEELQDDDEEDWEDDEDDEDEMEPDEIDLQDEPENQDPNPGPQAAAAGDLLQCKTGFPAVPVDDMEL